MMLFKAILEFEYVARDHKEATQIGDRLSRAALAVGPAVVVYESRISSGVRLPESSPEKVQRV